MIKHAYEKGNFVVYGTTGICVIDDVTEMSFMAGMEKSRYYVLKPEHSSDSKVYVPAANEKLSRLSACKRFFRHTVLPGWPRA